jgi:hypothetical protein
MGAHKNRVFMESKHTSFYFKYPLQIKKHQPNQTAKHQNIHFWVRGEKPFDAMLDHEF